MYLISFGVEDITKYAKEKRGIELTNAQKEILKNLMKGYLIQTGKGSGKTTAFKVYFDFLECINKQEYNETDLIIVNTTETLVKAKTDLD